MNHVETYMAMYASGGEMTLAEYQAKMHLGTLFKAGVIKVIPVESTPLIRRILLSSLQDASCLPSIPDADVATMYFGILSANGAKHVDEIPEAGV